MINAQINQSIRALIDENPREINEFADEFVFVLIKIHEKQEIPTKKTIFNQFKKFIRIQRSNTANNTYISVYFPHIVHTFEFYSSRCSQPAFPLWIVMTKIE